MGSRVSVGLEISHGPLWNLLRAACSFFPVSKGPGPWLGHCAGLTSCLPQFPPLPPAPVCGVPGDEGNQWLLYSLEGRHFALGGTLWSGGRGSRLVLGSLGASQLLLHWELRWSYSMEHLGSRGAGVEGGELCAGPAHSQPQGPAPPFPGLPPCTRHLHQQLLPRLRHSQAGGESAREIPAPAPAAG